MSKPLLSFLLFSGAVHVWAGLALDPMPEAPPQIRSIAVNLDGPGQAGIAAVSSRPAAPEKRPGEEEPLDPEPAPKREPDDNDESPTRANAGDDTESGFEAATVAKAETKPSADPVPEAVSRPADSAKEQVSAAPDTPADARRTTMPERVHDPEPATNTQPRVARHHDDSSQANQPARPRIEAELTRRLADHFSYPRLAQRRGWEGEVRIGMQISASGRISDIHVVEGSGYRVLDTAAVRSAGRIGRYPEAAELLQGRRLDVVIPVHYRLL